MKPSALTIVIPSEIVALPDLTLAERILIAHIREFPASSNDSLAKLVGLSIRGIEAMLRRLRERGLIEQVGNGRARQLLFRVEPHTNCEEKPEDAESHIKRGESKTVESLTSCGPDAAPNPGQPAPAPIQTDSPAVTIAKFVDDQRERAGDCIACADFGGALHHYHLAMERVADFPEKIKAEVLAMVTEEESRVLAWKLVFEHAKATNMSGSKLGTLFATITALSAERLAQLRPALNAQAQLGTPADISLLLAG